MLRRGLEKKGAFLRERVEAKPGDLSVLVLTKSFFNFSVGKGKGGVARGDDKRLAVIQTVLRGRQNNNIRANESKLNQGI